MIFVVVYFHQLSFKSHLNMCPTSNKPCYYVSFCAAQGRNGSQGYQGPRGRIGLPGDDGKRGDAGHKGERVSPSNEVIHIHYVHVCILCILAWYVIRARMRILVTILPVPKLIYCCV